MGRGERARHRPRGRAGGLLRAGLALLVALSCGVAGAADDELVQFLLKQGRAALEKNKVDDAIAKFRKATEEDADSVEAWLGLGQSCEKKADRTAATEAYRAAGPALERRRRAGRVADSDSVAAKRATARLDALVPGEAELRRLQESHVADLLELARSLETKDPAGARKAVETALRGAPWDGAALDLASRLAPASTNGKTKPEEPPSVDLLAGFSKWDDLVARKGFDSDSVTFEESSAFHDYPEHGQIVWTTPPSEVGERFALDLECRLLRRDRSNWLAGWAFFGRGHQFVSVLLKSDGVALVRSLGDDHENVTETDIPPPAELSAWRRLVVVVDGRSVVATVDGKKVIERSLPEEVETSGRIGVWTQYSKVEYRRLRVGSP